LYEGSYTIPRCLPTGVKRVNFTEESAMMLMYLLGFPSPVIEVLLVLVCFVLGFAVYFGLRFESVGVVEYRRKGDDEIRPGVDE
jgi:hypothetical protein